MHTLNIISTFLLGHFLGSDPAVFRIRIRKISYFLRSRIRTRSYGFQDLKKSFMLNFVVYY